MKYLCYRLLLFTSPIPVVFLLHTSYFHGMENIPIEFKWQGKEYEGTFTRVSGGGSAGAYHLMIDKFYYGQLIKTENWGWQFHSNKNHFTGMADMFGHTVMNMKK